MDWSQERYVRVYTRDTLTWKVIGWEGRAVLVLVMRKLDRSGLLDVGDYDLEDGVAVMIDMPVEITRIGLRRCIERGVFEVNQGVLVMPNFIEAQEAEASGAQRTREWRARRRDKARAATILRPGDESSPNGETNRHQNGDSGDGVTKSVTPNRAVPNRTVLNKEEEKEERERRAELLKLPTVPKKTMWENWLFDVVLPLYPEHRRGSGLAYARAWVNENKPDEALRAKIEGGVREWATSDYWQRDGGRFVDSLGKFFENEKWIGKPNHKKPDEKKPEKKVKFVG